MRLEILSNAALGEGALHAHCCCNPNVALLYNDKQKLHVQKNAQKVHSLC
jgi:hypothetical protein